MSHHTSLSSIEICSESTVKMKQWHGLLTALVNDIFSIAQFDIISRGNVLATERIYKIGQTNKHKYIGYPAVDEIHFVAFGANECMTINLKTNKNT